MKKYMQPAIYVFELKMENALMASSDLPDMSTSKDVEYSEEYTQHTIWNNSQWPYEE